MKKFVWIIIILVVIILLNPLWRPVDSIRAHVLRIIPLGTSITKAEKRINARTSWDIEWIDQDSGYGIWSDGRPAEGGEIHVGAKSMRVHLGEYKFFITSCDVIAFLGFDENGELIDVAVRKDYDSL